MNTERSRSTLVTGLWAWCGVVLVVGGLSWVHPALGAVVAGGLCIAIALFRDGRQR